MLILYFDIFLVYAKDFLKTLNINGQFNLNVYLIFADG